MSIRTIWLCGFSVFIVLVFVTLTGGAVTPVAIGEKVAYAALERTKAAVRYDGSYRRISYPMGDVPTELGVCTDLIVRAYRKVGVDLQQLVHEDMRLNFTAYPKEWGLKRPDPNIDHRRVLNLKTFFRRHGTALPVSEQVQDYRPGDLVTWRLTGSQHHIGIVSTKRAANGRPLIIHNIGSGPKLEDSLFAFPITGHFRYAG